jgi:hypothetical protein
MSMFLFKKLGVVIFILIYVDDIIVEITSSTHNATQGLLRRLGQDFASYFLGIEVRQIKGGIIPIQEKYASDLLKRVGMPDCKAVTTHLSVNEKKSMSRGLL